MDSRNWFFTYSRPLPFHKHPVCHKSDLFLVDLHKLCSWKERCTGVADLSPQTTITHRAFVTRFAILTVLEALFVVTSGTLYVLKARKNFQPSSWWPQKQCNVSSLTRYFTRNTILKVFSSFVTTMYVTKKYLSLDTN